MATKQEDEIYLRFKTDTEQAQNDITKFNKKMDNLNKTINLFKVGALIKGMESIGNTIGKLVNKQSDLIESTNKYRAVMGDFSNITDDFIDKAERTFGLDKVQLQDSVSTFQALTTGFGISADKASIMSQQLTQLSYDLSSFQNIPVEQAFQKIKSGLAGKICLVYKGLYTVTHLTAGNSKHVMV